MRYFRRNSLNKGKSEWRSINLLLNQTNFLIMAVSSNKFSSTNLRLSRSASTSTATTNSGGRWPYTSPQNVPVKGHKNFKKSKNCSCQFLVKLSEIFLDFRHPWKIWTSMSDEGVANLQLFVRQTVVFKLIDTQIGYIKEPKFENLLKY